MTVSRAQKSEENLEEAAIVDTIRQFINVQSRDWVRRQQNALIPSVLRLVDDARNGGDSIDVGALIKQVWLDGQVPRPALGVGE